MESWRTAIRILSQRHTSSMILLSVATWPLRFQRTSPKELERTFDILALDPRDVKMVMTESVQIQLVERYADALQVGFLAYAFVDLKVLRSDSMRLQEVWNSNKGDSPSTASTIRAPQGRWLFHWPALFSCRSSMFSLVIFRFARNIVNSGGVFF